MVARESVKWAPPAEHLLLLPHPPSEITIPALRSAYEPALRQVMEEHRNEVSKKSQTPAGAAPPWVIVAIFLNDLDCDKPRPSTYKTCQHLFAKMYKLIAILMAEKAAEQEAAEHDQVDFRIVLVTDQSPAGHAQGPFLTLGGFTTSPRNWSRVYVVDSEVGMDIWKRFLGLYLEYHHIPTQSAAPFQMTSVPGGTTMKIRGREEESGKQNTRDKGHYSVAVGGTFDHLHIGHKLLLSAAAFLVEPFSYNSETAQELIIGITGDALLKSKKYAKVLESWDQRQAAVSGFLVSITDFERDSIGVEREQNEKEGGREVRYFTPRVVFRCVEISNPYGPTITEDWISALVVSGETRSGGKAVNDKRLELRMQPLEVFEVDVLDASADEASGTLETESYQSKISSTEIRKRLQQRSAAALQD